MGVDQGNGKTVEAPFSMQSVSCPRTVGNQLFSEFLVIISELHLSGFSFKESMGPLGRPGRICENVKRNLKKAGSEEMRSPLRLIK
jgi:hypothetical protein